MSREGKSGDAKRVDKRYKFSFAIYRHNNDKEAIMREPSSCDLPPALRQAGTLTFTLRLKFYFVQRRSRVHGRCAVDGDVRDGVHERRGGNPVGR